MRTPEIDKALEKTISVKRLDKYLSVMNGDLGKSLKLYEVNTRHAEAFYTPLQCLARPIRESAVFWSDWCVRTPPLTRRTGLPSAFHRLTTGTLQRARSEERRVG